MAAKHIESERETRIRDLADDFFLKDPDVKDALSMWNRGFYSTDVRNDLIERQRGRAWQHAVLAVSAEEDEHASHVGIGA